MLIQHTSEMLLVLCVTKQLHVVSAVARGCEACADSTYKALLIFISLYFVH